MVCHRDAECEVPTRVPRHDVVLEPEELVDGFGGGVETLVQEDELSKVEDSVERQMPFVGLKAAMQELDALQGSDDEEV